MNVVDSHVHFWDPRELHYPWLEHLASLNRAFLPAEYVAASSEPGAAKVVLVEANCRSDESGREVQWLERLARSEGRIAGIVAFADLSHAAGLERSLDRLTGCPLVKGIRHNIQGQRAGFALRPAFVEGVRSIGRRGLTFDLCVTHDQLCEVADMVERCPDTRFVLDHCGKPAIRGRLLEPWSQGIARLAGYGNVWCKLSGLLTEAAPGWSEDDLMPYAEHALQSFGMERVMYGSDWPVLTVAGRYCDWYAFTWRLAAQWTALERSRFYADTAARVYRL